MVKFHRFTGERLCVLRQRKQPVTVDVIGANNSLKCKSNRHDYSDVAWVGKTEHIMDPFSAVESGSIWLGDWDYKIADTWSAAKLSPLSLSLSLSICETRRYWKEVRNSLEAEEP